MKSTRCQLTGCSLMCAIAISPVHAAARPTACFTNMNAYMTAHYGADFRDDENLHVSSIKYGKMKFTLFIDMTPGTNVSSVLLRANAHKELCVVLATYPAARLELVNVDGKGMPTEFRTIDQAPPGSAGNEIFYRLVDGSRYIAAVCNKVTWKGQRIAKRRVACSAASD